MKRKTALMAASATLIVLGGLTFASQTQAFGFRHFDGSFISKLASKLGKSEAEVQTAFQQIRTENMAERRVELVKKLDELVQKGSYTTAQKEAILAKFDELQTQRANRSPQPDTLTREQMVAKMQAEKTALQDWAKAQGIDLSLIAPFLGGPVKEGSPRGARGQGMMRR